MNRLIVPAAFLTLCLPALARPAHAEDTQSNNDTPTYLLRYSLNAGEALHYEVTHVAKTKTRIRGAEEVSQVHTISQRHWAVKTTNEQEMTFDHVVDAVEMTQQQGDSEEIRWDSESGEKPPALFKRVSDHDLASRKRDPPREQYRQQSISGHGDLGSGFP